MLEFKMRDYGKSSFRSGRRDKLEIVSAIISITQQPSSITQLLGDANLGYSQLKEYLRFMLGRRLIEKRDLIRGAERTTQVYQATEKGNRFLELYCEILILLQGERFLENNSKLSEAYLLSILHKKQIAPT